MLDGGWPAVRPTFLARLRDPGIHPIAYDVALEFGENGEHARESSAAGGGHIERLGERDEADADGIELLQSADQVE
jgi:hypothetical protein